VGVTFDYRTANEAEILAKAKELEGRTVGTIPGALLGAASAAAGKSEVGLAVERHFGIPPNASPLPDFPGAGIELKVVPMLRRGQELVVKERTVISLIDYHALMEETWATASVRKKLNVLLVYFEHLPGRPKREFPIHLVHLWRPDDRTETFLQADWEQVFAKVRRGRAHELSESDGKVMGPCTKAATGATRRSQPFGGHPAIPRAWALKPSFTMSLYRSIVSRRAVESLGRNVGATGTLFESRLLERFRRFEGRTIDDVAAELDVPPSTSKSYGAAVVRRIFGARSFRTRILEFEEMGITPRITRVGDDLMPYEATSFPAFRYRDLLAESWEDSDLLAHVEYMLFVPIHGEAKRTPQGDCTLHTPVFWHPTTQELDLIRREWELYRLEIEQGRALDLTPASETTAIHVRPHGRDSRDVDEAPIVGPVVKKSFWLNKPFVQRLLRRHS
jgi:DNA mismatch repair protein MutH